MPALCRRWLSRHAGEIALLLIATGLTLLALTWMGYDLRLIARAIIGDQGGSPYGQNETAYGYWMLYQAFDNLLERPLDPGYSTMFYGDPESFACSTGHYGIALFMLPIYLFTGKNLVLTFNLYHIATFPLTAWAAYLLSRHLLKAPTLAAILAGLIFAFNPYRLVHIWHIEVLSTQFYLLALYSLHRLLDTPRWPWAVGLGLASTLTALASGYLGLTLILAGATILLFAGAKRVVRKSHLVQLIVAGTLAVALILPLSAFRFNNPTFAQGQAYQDVLRYSAKPSFWLTGSTLIYGGHLPTPASWERSLLIGIVPLVLSVLAWIGFKAQGPMDQPQRTFSRREVVWLYTVIALLGYLLTLGPELRLGNLVLPMPYRLLAGWPVFREMRAPTRQIFLSLTGVTLLSAAAITLILEHLKPPLKGATLAIIVLLLAVEFFPYDGLTPRPPFPLRDARKFLHPTIREADLPVVAWLAAQPPDTPVFHYPAYYASAFEYLAYLPFHEQPMLNGAAGLMPEWYQEVPDDDFPSGPLLHLLRERGIRYVLIHDDLMPPDRHADFMRRWIAYQAIWGTFPRVGVLGKVEVYELRSEPLHSLHFDFDGPVAGVGWHAPVRDYRGATYQWTSAETATIELYLLDDDDLHITFRVLRGMQPDSLDSLALSVNGFSVALSKHQDAAGATLFEGTIPRSTLGGPVAITQLVFQTNRVAGLQNFDAADAPRFGLLFDWLDIKEIGRRP